MFQFPVKEQQYLDETLTQVLLCRQESEPSHIGIENILPRTRAADVPDFNNEERFGREVDPRNLLAADIGAEEHLYGVPPVSKSPDMQIIDQENAVPEPMIICNQAAGKAKKSLVQTA